MQRARASIAIAIFAIGLVLLTCGFVAEDLLERSVRSLWSPESLLSTALLTTVYAMAAAMFGLVPLLQRYRRSAVLVLLVLLALGTVGLAALVAVSIVFAVSVAVGSLCWATQDAERPFDDGLVQIGVGLVFVGFVGWALCRFQVNYVLFYGPLTVAVLIMRRQILSVHVRGVLHWLGDPLQAQTRPPRYALAAIGVLATVHGFLVGLFPTVGFDAIAQHLRFVNTLYATGSWRLDPELNGFLLSDVR